MPSILVDASSEPDDTCLADALGKAKRPWDALLQYLEGCAGVVRSWKFYGKKHGWQLRAAQGKRVVLYLIPLDGAFTAALALRPQALETARASLPADLVREIDGARPGPEGHPARVLVRTAKDAALVKRLLAIKLGA